MKQNRAGTLIGVVLAPLLAVAADKPAPHAIGDVDPLALDVLRAVAEPVEHAERLSFKALLAEEQPASNGQVVTFFRTVEVSAQRPDKVHAIFTKNGERVDFFASNGQVVMYSPEAKIYSVLMAGKTIDETLAGLHAKAVDLPVATFVRSNLFELASKSLSTAYVVGRSQLDGKTVHQLAFTSADANWQTWVTGGAEPRFVRVEIVNKQLQGQPRTTIQFLDWNLSPHFSDAEFTFQKPPDAAYASVRSDSGGQLR